MEFPNLVRWSEGLQEIKYPEDFSLDHVVDAIFNKGFGNVDSKASMLARNIILHPETDMDAIRSRQEILQYFMDHKDLTETVLKNGISERGDCLGTQLDHFFLKADTAASYLLVLLNLSSKFQELPNTDNPELESLRNTIINVAKSKETRDIFKVLDDIHKPHKLYLQIPEFCKRAYPEDGYKKSQPSIKIVFDSGAKYEGYDLVSLDTANSSLLNIRYSGFFDSTIDQLNKPGKDKFNFWKPIKLELYVDEEKGTIKGKASQRKVDLGKTIRSFRIKTRTVEAELDFNPDTFIIKSEFSRALKWLTAVKYRHIIQKVDDQINRLSSALVELKYFARAADYFIKIQEKNIPVTMPRIVEPDNKEIYIKGLVEPNLLRKTELGDIVANDVSSEASGNVHVITGPNNNGKTTYINAIGIAQAMTQAGLMVFAKEAVISPIDNIFTHYIRPGDLVNGESRYAHELSRIKEILKKATGNSLILMDEPCSGTSPEDGKQESDAVLRTIGELGATTYVTTHFHNLIDTANELPYGRNLCCVAKEEGENLTYTYKIIQGSSKQSNGTHLARKIGADMEGLKSILAERKEKERLVLRHY